jgi:uncharacterized protein YjbI with pentapeptide repeats
VTIGKQHLRIKKLKQFSLKVWKWLCDYYDALFHSLKHQVLTAIVTCTILAITTCPIHPDEVKQQVSQLDSTLKVEKNQDFSIDEKPYELSYKDWLEYQINYRDSWARLIGGLFVFFGILIAFHRLNIARDDQKIAQEEQMTNRFSKAAELLGHENISVRMAALYALERIANDSDKDYDVIMETIAAYIRSLNPLIEPEKETTEDTNAAMNILGQRKRKNSISSLNSINLSKLKLTSKKKDFSDFSFLGVNFSKSDLRYVNFSKSELKEAIFNQSTLNHANFTYAHLPRSTIIKASLENANFTHANLISADLQGSNLNDSILNMAHCTNTNFSDAQLRNADLQNASLHKANLDSSFLNKANLEGADLNLATMKEAYLIEANLATAKHLTWDQLESAKDLTGAKLPDYLLQNCPVWYPRQTTED